MPDPAESWKIGLHCERWNNVSPKRLLDQDFNHRDSRDSMHIFVSDRWYFGVFLR
jgi:hypothetical protein